MWGPLNLRSLLKVQHVGLFQSVSVCVSRFVLVSIKQQMQELILMAMKNFGLQNSFILLVFLFFFSSWEARLASMYNRAVQPETHPSSQPAEQFWSSTLLHLQSQLVPSPVHSRAPPGGAVVLLSVPESSTPLLLSVSEFSVLLTFVTPGNRQTTVALWDLESRSVSYHRAEGEAAPVQFCGERQHRLLLKSKFNMKPPQSQLHISINTLSFSCKHCNDRKF